MGSVSLIILEKMHQFEQMRCDAIFKSCRFLIDFRPIIFAYKQKLFKLFLLIHKNIWVGLICQARGENLETERFNMNEAALIGKLLKIEVLFSSVATEGEWASAGLIEDET